MASPPYLSGLEVRNTGMALVRIKPTRFDVELAHLIARHTRRTPEYVMRPLTWCADERLLVILATAGWIITRPRSKAARRAGNHALLVTAAVSLLPHLMKRVIDQTRPDRLTIEGHFHGIPFSGRGNDAFPSGHALHMGALASAAAAWRAGFRATGFTLATILSLTRVFMLAHWASDVAAGFAFGAATERLLRTITGYPAGLKAARRRRR